MTTQVLSSWNDGPAKTAVVDFIRTVTESGEGFVPPAERIATFDNDGTLWCEKPAYPQADFLIRRWAEQVDLPGRGIHDHIEHAWHVGNLEVVAGLPSANGNVGSLQDLVVGISDRESAEDGYTACGALNNCEFPGREA